MIDFLSILDLILTPLGSYFETWRWFLVTQEMFEKSYQFYVKFRTKLLLYKMNDISHNKHTYVICMHICELRCLYVYLFVILRIFIINCLPQSMYCSHKQTTYNAKLCWYYNSLLYTGCFVDDKRSFDIKYLKVFCLIRVI